MTSSELFFFSTIKTIADKLTTTEMHVDVVPMEGCLVEGDFSTYRKGFGINIIGDESDARDLKQALEEELGDFGLSFSYRKQTASNDMNNDLEEESYKFSHVIAMLPKGE